MSACGAIAVRDWGIEGGLERGEEEAAGCGEGSRLYLRHGGIHHYSARRFEVEARWISQRRQNTVLIKTRTMKAESPCRNEGFEESVNAPFRGGGQEITVNITIMDSEASVTKWRGFFCSSWSVCTNVRGSWCPTFWLLWWHLGPDRSDRLRWAAGT